MYDQISVINTFLHTVSRRIFCKNNSPLVIFRKNLFDVFILMKLFKGVFRKLISDYFNKLLLR